MTTIRRLADVAARWRRRWHDYDSFEARAERAASRTTRRYRRRDGTCDVELVAADLGGETTAARKRRWARVCFGVVAFDVGLVALQIAIALSAPSVMTWTLVATWSVIYGAFGVVLVGSGLDSLRESRSAQPGYFMRQAACEAISGECGAGGRRRVDMLAALAGRYHSEGVLDALYARGGHEQSPQVCQAMAEYAEGSRSRDWLVTTLAALEHPACVPVAKRLDEERDLDERYPSVGGEWREWRAARLVNGPRFDEVLDAVERLEAAGDTDGSIFAALAERRPYWSGHGPSTEDLIADVEGVAGRLAPAEGAREVFCGLIGDWHGDLDSAVHAALLVADVGSDKRG